MKVRVISKESGIDKGEHDFFKDFIQFLQKQYPLKKDIEIYFLGKKTPKMSTGSDTDTHKLYVLSKNRLNRDIVRTLAHEWYHEYQKTILHQKSKRNIGGKFEDDANAISGQLVKKFERYHPKHKKTMYK